MHPFPLEAAAINWDTRKRYQRKISLIKKGRLFIQAPNKRKRRFIRYLKPIRHSLISLTSGSQPINFLTRPRTIKSSLRRLSNFPGQLISFGRTDGPFSLSRVMGNRPSKNRISGNIFSKECFSLRCAQKGPCNSGENGRASIKVISGLKQLVCNQCRYEFGW